MPLSEADTRAKLIDPTLYSRSLNPERNLNRREDTLDRYLFSSRTLITYR